MSNTSDFACKLMLDVIKAEQGIKGRDPGPWRVVAEYLADLEARVAMLEKQIADGEKA